MSGAEPVATGRGHGTRSGTLRTRAGKPVPRGRKGRLMNLDFIPIWVWFAGTVAIILISVEEGFRLGRQGAKRSADEKESPVAAMGGAVLGLVAFMLAFTFSIASGRYDTRKELVREDAGAIRTAYLRADFLEEADRAEAKGLLRGYLDYRVEFARAGGAQGRSEAEGAILEAHGRMWGIAVENARKDMNSDVGALFLESINDVINVHALRVTVALDTRIPVGIWAILYAISVLGMMAVGYQAGIAGSQRSRTSVILAVSFALVMTLIAGMDRPNTPFMSVTQKPLADLQAWMAAEAGAQQ